MKKRYIDPMKLKMSIAVNTNKTLEEVIDDEPSADVVLRKQYEELREAFVDYVCSGVQNQAPYCKNRCCECVDERGWCTYQRCRGFNPDGKKYGG